MNTFANRMRQLRLEANLTGSEMGAKFNMTKSAISSYETRGRFCDEQLLKEFAAFFNVSIDYLMGTSDVRNVVSEKTKGFAERLVKQLVEENMITDINNIPDSITDMIISALRADISNKKRD